MAAILRISRDGSVAASFKKKKKKKKKTKRRKLTLEQDQKEFEQDQKEFEQDQKEFRKKKKLREKERDRILDKRLSEEKNYIDETPLPDLLVLAYNLINNLQRKGAKLNPREKKILEKLEPYAQRVEERNKQMTRSIQGV
tara:strand:+ start:2191 stop:2610 length:420 start_codon:yes stop_codon:yes gene_type:complete